MTIDPAATLTNMARQLLTAQSDQPLDRTAIERAVQGVAPIVAATAGRDFAADELTGIVRLLESLFVVEQGEALALTDAESLRNGTSESVGVRAPS